MSKKQNLLRVLTPPFLFISCSQHIFLSSITFSIGFFPPCFSKIYKFLPYRGKKSHFPLATLLFLLQCYFLKSSLCVHSHNFILSTVKSITTLHSSSGSIFMESTFICIFSYYLNYLSSCLQHLLTLTIVPHILSV